MENLQISARTVEEATKKALTRLNVGLEEIEVTVLKEGRGGILGLGAEDAVISVKLLTRDSGNDSGNENEELNKARAILDTLLKGIDVTAKIDIQVPAAMLDEDGADNPVVFNITGDDLGGLIGRRGQTLDALQYLVRLIFARQTKSKMPIMVDVEGYKQRRFEDLKTLALNVADQVKSKRSSVRLEPMTPYERRIVHMTLANDPDVETESIGEGESRKIVVSPKYKK
jgi:spoIIIJ-associated protein